MLDNDKIGKQIALLRKEKGLTGEGLAELLLVSAQAVSKWENGRCLPETAILPSLTKALGCSIDTLLTPQELLIINAVYSDGVKCVDVTQNVNSLVNGNVLNITVNTQYLSAFLDSPRLKVLTVKFQTPDGVYYTFSEENSIFYLDLASKAIVVKSSIQIIGAYYGNKEDYRSTLGKMEHYDYYHWDEIHVDHESFPSSTETDDIEYLTLVYINEKGIFVISCEENESIYYNKDRTFLYLKDKSTCILPDIHMLKWEQHMDCTWAGSIYNSLKYMGEEITYDQVMGYSGACYRLSFTDVWDYSSTDALVSFDYSSKLFEAIGYEAIWADRIEKADRKTERKRIVQDIDNNKPIIAINLRIAPEWGIITGYLENGKRLLCRTYFDGIIFEEQKEDKDFLNENGGYLESDFWPFMIVHFGKKLEKPSADLNLIRSLKILIDSFHAPCERGYYQGKEAYLAWISGLKNDKLWTDCDSQESVERRITVNDYMLLNLIDARRSAGAFLRESCYLLSNSLKKIFTIMISNYATIAHKLEQFRMKTQKSLETKVQYNNIIAGSVLKRALRQEQIALLEEILAVEEGLVLMAEEIISGLE